MSRNQRTPDIVGALNGSRFIEQPHIAPEVETFRAFIAGSAPVLIEVGFDHGRRLHSTASLNPDWRVVGLEVRERRVNEAIERARRDGLTNVHPWRMDARTVFGAVLAPDCVDVVEVLFPTPWWNPALRRKRLLVTESFLMDAHRALKPGGLLHLATDVAAYAESIEQTLVDLPFDQLEATQAQALRPRCNQLSRREWKCERDGLPIHRWLLTQA